MIGQCLGFMSHAQNARARSLLVFEYKVLQNNRIIALVKGHLLFDLKIIMYSGGDSPIMKRG